MYSDKWKKILDEVNEFTMDANIWFRGHSSTSYSLNSGLFRLNFNNIEEYITTESQLYTYYKSLGYMLHTEDNPWHLLYSMQHYGVKTRLLDWTESFAVALFFATENWKSGNTPRIWLLKPLQLNKLARDKAEIISPNKLEYPATYNDTRNSLNSLAIYPIKNSRRILAQHGVFTIQGNSGLPLDKEFNGELVNLNVLKSIDLPWEVQRDAFQYLKQNGINRYSLFPDLDGLALHINQLLIPPYAL
ncbi:FRG domain-containing protein [Bacillus sp. FJAT-49711]|uniref:FRG domain-containing protein n=1 Tax=Bacillus sp. FJAT-49711 TaxID=2833585 RepID=UPI001BC8D863|nr:FRG domain-containing protein [Bacillus sp. FJAT-49711]MBS4218323.1 FRG domain-containing protein [Bacillus sp. FJAT-49711]